ncbi:MAG: diaminopimelate epimerase [Alphaproteobacteria bacterium]|nr:diaminopimelate epimerase [Alphaproteobacteria bacterium]
MSINFKKMHGLGNDFVIIDGRENGLTLTPDQVRFIADRKRGVGCDLVVLLKYSKNWTETTFAHLINADGSEIEACGNATRCIADILMTEAKTDNVVVETLYGGLNCFREQDGQIRVEMGKPQLGWQDIPLSKENDTLHLPLEGDPVAVSMGNPHCIFFVDNIMDKWGDNQVEKVGQTIEVDPLFPNKTNVEFVEVLAPDHLRMRVWERGVGITEACGSGACASAVAAIRRGLTGRKVRVTLDGGDLIIDWPHDDAPVSMTGPVAYVFDGEIQV